MNRLLVLSFLFLATASVAQPLPRDRRPEQRPALLVMGSVHFANPGRDQTNIQVEDITTPSRQREIEAVVEQLESFHPTHVAVEWPRAKQAALDQLYRDYRDGKYVLSRSERDQIGLRLAAKLGLARVDAVDWNGMPPGDFKLYDWDAWGKAHGLGDRIAALSDPKNIPFELLGNHSVGDWLLTINQPKTLAALHHNYFDIARIGVGEEQPGAAWVGTWYARNLRIFNNLVNLAPQPKDRVLVIYGVGHAYLLRQMAQESGAFRLVDVEQVLKPGPAR